MLRSKSLIRYDRCISGMNTEFNVPDASPMSHPPTFHPNHFPPKCSMPRVVAIGGWAESRCSSAAGNFTCPKENLGPRGHAMSTAQCLGSHIPIRKPGPAWATAKCRTSVPCSFAPGNACGRPQEEAISLRVVGCPVPGPRDSCWERDRALIGSFHSSCHK